MFNLHGFYLAMISMLWLYIFYILVNDNFMDFAFLNTDVIVIVWWIIISQK